MIHDFYPQIKTISQLNGLRPTNDIRNEPMLFGASINFADKHGGLLTKEILETILSSEDFANLTKEIAAYTESKDIESYIVIDSRVTMTMRGSYPSIPGWHCDDVPRHEKYAQPDLNARTPYVHHYMVLLADTEALSCTEFITKPVSVELDEANVWHSLDNTLNKLQNKETRFIKQGELIRFNQQTIHRASPTAHPGWRLFFRLSITHRKPHDEIRKQVQIYTPLNGGW